MRFRKTALILIFAAFLGTSTTLAGCGTSASATIATYGDGQTLSFGVANFYARYQQAVYDMMFGTYNYDDYWHSEGTYFTEDDVKEYVLEDLEKYCVVSLHADEYDAAITDEQSAAIAEAVDQFLSDNGSDTLKAMDATEETVTKCLELITIEHNVEEALGEEVDTEVDPEDSLQRTFTFIRIPIEYAETDEESDSSVSEEEQEVDETQYAEVQEIAEQAKEDFDGAVTAAEDAGYYSSTHSYGNDYEEGDFYDSVIDAADSMSDGDVSDIIVEDDNYFIIRLDSEDDADARADKEEEIIEERQDEHFDEVYAEWQEDANFTVKERLWSKVTFDSYFMAQSEDTSTDTEEAEDLSTETEETEEVSVSEEAAEEAEE